LVEAAQPPDRGEWASGTRVDPRESAALMDKAERLLDLVALLLDAREPVSFADLRDAFPDEYGGNRDNASRKLARPSLA